MKSIKDVPYSTAFTATKNTKIADNDAVVVKEKTDANTRHHIVNLVVSAASNVQVWFVDDDGTTLIPSFYVMANTSQAIPFSKECPHTVTANKDFCVRTNIAASITVVVSGYTD